MWDTSSLIKAGTKSKKKKTKRKGNCRGETRVLCPMWKILSPSPYLEDLGLILLRKLSSFLQTREGKMLKKI